MLIFTVCLIILIVVFFVIKFYNVLVRNRNDVKNAWSAIDVQLKRRHDLIPGIVEAVKGYASHERQTLDSVIKARQSAATSFGSIEARAKAENALSALLRALRFSRSIPEP